MKFTSKVALAAIGTSAVVLLSGDSSTKDIQTRNRQLSFFDPHSTDPKASPTAIGGHLEFVHIPRNAGTAVETAAWTQKQIVWGACHANEWPHIGCNKPDWPHKFDWMGPSVQDRKYNGETFLAPPKWLHPNPYEGKDTFTVIRNPYDRIVGEYHSMSRSSSTFHNSKDPREMNEWIQLKLKEVMQLTFYPGHFLPQHFYVYSHHRNQAVTHVLRYENLHHEFHNLMKQYNLDITLPPKPSFSDDFTKESLSPDTIAMINNLYRADFKTFGYNMVERPSQFSLTDTSYTKAVPTKFSVSDVLTEETPSDHQFEDRSDIAQQQAAMAGMGGNRAPQQQSQEVNIQVTDGQAQPAQPQAQGNQGQHLVQQQGEAIVVSA